MQPHLLFNYPFLIGHDISEVPIHLFQRGPRRQPRLRRLIPLVIPLMIRLNKLILALVDEVFEVLLLQLL